ncbi:hypothetical protein A5687_01900 [Mycobacterium mantenii]|nr:hypothetical protein A5687_01900 [Mycobacterium mantenii]
MTAANSTPLTDGASAAVMASGERVAELGIEPLARVVSSAVYGIDPLIMGLARPHGLPICRSARGSDLPGGRPSESPTPFSAQALGVLRELPDQFDGFVIPDEKLTPSNGAVAIGHLFGANGTRYVLTLANRTP